MWFLTPLSHKFFLRQGLPSTHWPLTVMHLTPNCTVCTHLGGDTTRCCKSCIICQPTYLLWNELEGLAKDFMLNRFCFVQLSNRSRRGLIMRELLLKTVHIFQCDIAVFQYIIASNLHPTQLLQTLCLVNFIHIPSIAEKWKQPLSFFVLVPQLM